jgi:hypothetical protein
LYRQKPEEQFWFTYLADAQTIYVNFRGYRDEFAKHADELLSSIKENSAKRLVIDVRQNRGGDFIKVPQTVIAWPETESAAPKTWELVCGDRPRHTIGRSR